MKLVMVSVEGQTEEAVLNQVIQPHLEPLGLVLQPVLVETKHVAGRSAYKGGLSSWAKARREIRALLGNTAAAMVTTMYDLFAFPDDGPGVREAAVMGNATQRVQAVESALADEIDHQRFLPYLSLFELEALVLAAPAPLAQLGMDADFSGLKGLPPPEQVNDTNPPSYRILECWPGYAKPVDGPAVLAAAGLAPVRAACPHFDKWVTRLEDLGRGGTA